MDADHWSVRDTLVADGVLGKGRGHGGLVYLVDGAVEGTDEEQVGTHSLHSLRR